MDETDGMRNLWLIVANRMDAAGIPADLVSTAWFAVMHAHGAAANSAIIVCIFHCAPVCSRVAQLPSLSYLMDKTLLLVDGSSYLYRAFHALPDLRNAEGAPTGAIYGMINMLRRLRKDYPAAYIACVFDAKGKTFRDDMYPAYKAQRASMPEDLTKQIEPIHEAVRAMGWPILMVDGIEADDVIGTLAVAAAAKGMQTIVSTGDKDLAQLVNDQVLLVNTMSNEKLDKDGVIAKFGVPPERIVDYLTLVGDTVDNVPG